MGIMKTNAPGLGDVLFTKTQRQVLSLLFGNPDKSFYANEIVRYAGVGIGSVLRELEKLSSVGLLVIEKIGNQKHYQANRKSPIFEELRGVVQKTFGLADVIRKALDEFRDSVELAFIYGSVAKGTDKANSDVDVMIISDQLSYSEVLASVAPIEANIGRPVNPTIYTTKEFKNLVDIGQLKEEPGDQSEFDGLVHSGRSRLNDARLDVLSIESQFDLAYNAAHALALAALRWKGYRSDNRYISFPVFTPHVGGKS